jgi:hypothetical protein
MIQELKTVQFSCDGQGCNVSDIRFINKDHKGNPLPPGWEELVDHPEIAPNRFGYRLRHFCPNCKI